MILGIKEEFCEIVGKLDELEMGLVMVGFIFFGFFNFFWFNIVFL